MTNEIQGEPHFGDAECSTESAPNPANSPHPAWRILVVEDVPSQQKLLVKVLTKSGHSVASADSGREAVDLVEREPFDLVMMDVQMPGMNGLDAMRAIREREGYTGGHVPIVAVSSHALNSDADQCYAAGADAYIPKPINLVDLMAVLQKAAALGRPAD
ncbi:MAG: response regulator [Planctomycetia bacterium]|nr:response regulator [Planctomycetia bacterium]